MSVADQQRVDELVGKIVVPLQLACETRQYALMSVALDCFQKLLLYGYVNGDAADVEQPDRQLVERVLFVINSAFQKRRGEKTYPDDHVQLQVLKALLAAVVAPRAGVHGPRLLGVLRTCYNVHIMSTSPLIGVTARATLDQIVGAVFQRLEREGALLQQQQQRQQAGSAGAAEGATTDADDYDGEDDDGDEDGEATTDAEGRSEASEYEDGGSGGKRGVIETIGKGKGKRGQRKQQRLQQAQATECAAPNARIHAAWFVANSPCTVGGGMVGARSGPS